MAETTSQLQQKLLALTDGKVDIMIDENNFKNTTQILREMAAEWENMTDVEQAAALELLGGKRQANTLSAILANFDIVEDAIETSANSSGSALKENEKYLDSIQGRINLFNNAVQTMWNNALDSDTIKAFVNLGTELVKIIDKVGLLNSLFIALAGYTMFKHKMGPITFFKELIAYIPKLISLMKSKDLKTIEGIKTKIADTFATEKNTKANRENAASSVVAGEAEDKDTQDTMENVTATATDTATTNANTAQNGVNAASNITHVDFKKGKVIDNTSNKTTEGATTALSGLAKAIAAIPGWVKIVVVVATAVITAVTAGLVLITKSVKELEEEFDKSKSKYDEQKSKVESLNSELETTRERIAELEAMPSLSFVDQEELNRLKQREDSLARQIELEKQLLETQYKRMVYDAQKYAEATWKGTNWGDQAYSVMPHTGLIIEDKWWSIGVDTEEALDKSFSKYEKMLEFDRKKYPGLEFFNSSEFYPKEMPGPYTMIETMLDGYDTLLNDIDWGTVFDFDSGLKLQDRLNTISQGFDKGFEDKKQQMLEGMYDVLYNPEYDSLEYGMGDKTDEFLDKLYAYRLKYRQVQGDYVKPEAISSLFDSTSTKEMQNLGKELQKIVDDDSVTDKNQAILDKLDELDGIADGDVKIDKLADAYNRLGISMETVGVTAQDIADYFVLETGVFDSSTVEGITAQYSKAAEAINKFKDGLSVDGIDSDGNTVSFNFDDLFTFDDTTNKWQTDAEKVSQILKGADEQTREQFTKYITNIKNAQQEAEDAGKEFDITAAFAQASKNIEIDGLLRVIDITKESLSSINKTTFQGVADEIDGLIDTFDEFGKALENTASAMDTLYKAQEQMNSSGRISIKTALELMQSTEDWNSVLKINGDTITLQDDAEQALIQTRLNLIERNIDTALSEAELKYAQLEGADATLLQGEADLATINAQKEFDKAMNQSTAVSAGLGAAAGKLIEQLKALASLDFDSSAWNTSIIGAFNTAYGSALTVLDKQIDPESAEEIKQRILDLRAQKDMIGQLKSSPDAFKNYYDYDKKPGDKYDDTGSALDRLKEKYERKIKNIEGQQTYLENEVERLEAEDKAVSKDYYEEQISLEEQKIDLYKQERAELLKLKRTDEVAAQLWEVEHAIQESTLRTIEFRKSITQLYEEAFQDIMQSYDNKEDFTGDQQNYIDRYMELMKLQGKDIGTTGYQSLIDIEKGQLKDNENKLASLRATLAQGVADGSIKKGSKVWVQMQSDIRDTEAAILDNKITIEEYKKSLKQLSVDAFNDSRKMFANRDEFLTNQQDYISGYIDQLEAMGLDAPQEAYDELISLEKKKRENSVKDLIDARKDLAKIEAQGYTAADDEWQDAYQQIVELEKGIQDSDIAMANWQQTILDMDFSKLEEFLTLLKDVNTEISNLDNIIAREDLYNDDGTWTEAGITSLGLKYQDYINSKEQADLYSKEIKKIDEAYKKGLEYDANGDGKGEVLTPEKYEEYRKKLVDGQWDSLKSMYDAKDAMVDMEEARIDKIEEAANREVEAYQELIDVKREELDAERDLYEFKKDVEKQTKDLASLERRIASLSGSTDASDVAERRKLEAELAEAQEGLNDTYYSHSKDSQSKALDEEMDAFQEAKDKMIETLREGLEDTEAIFKKLLGEVALNADVIGGKINETAEADGITLSDLLTNPWKAAGEAATQLKLDAEGILGSMIGEDGIITLFSASASESLSKPFLDAIVEETGPIAKFEGAVETAIDNVKIKVNGEDGNTGYLGNGLGKPWEDASKDDGPIATFSEKVNQAIEDAQEKVSGENGDGNYLGDAVAKPWEQGSNAANTFAEDVGEALDKAITEAQEKVPKINAEINKIKNLPSYTGSDNNNGNGNGNGNGNNGNNNPPKTTNTGNTGYNNGSLTTEQVKALQKHLGVEADGYWGAKSQAAAKKKWGVTSATDAWTKYALQKAGSKVNGAASSSSGTVPQTLRTVAEKHAQVGFNIGSTTYSKSEYNKMIKKDSSGQTYIPYTAYGKKDEYVKSGEGYTATYEDGKYKIDWHSFKPTYKLVQKYHAKGTLGTKRDEWAITDESWIGEEITLAAGKHGQLQYLKKGSAVMPADISANLIEWGKLNPNALTMPTMGGNVNIMSNAVIQPNFEFNFDSLVHVDHCDEGTLKGLEKMVDNKLDYFSKQLNYSIKKFAR